MKTEPGERDDSPKSGTVALFGPPATDNANDAPPPPATDNDAPPLTTVAPGPGLGDEAKTLPRPPDDPDTAAPEGLSGYLRPGQVLFNRYRVEKFLSAGGMGQVWLVRHLELNNARVLKIIDPRFAVEPQALEWFRREARVMADLYHPNIVVVHDARVDPGGSFIEMEYVRGESLNRYLETGVPRTLEWTAPILEQLCDALQVAHEHKIVHRDLKPSNMMLVEGRPPGKDLKVLDFGIAKILSAESPASDMRTLTQGFLGTYHYASPEQINVGEVDGRSDLYSVGVILYEMLTGYRPFEGHPMRIGTDHLTTPPPPFTTRNPAASVPPEVERFVMRCLSKSPDDRPQTAHALFQEFLQACPDLQLPTGQSSATTLRLGGPASSRGTGRGVLPDTEREPDPATTALMDGVVPPPPKTRLWPWIAAVASLIVILAAVVLLRPKPSPGVRPGPTVPSSIRPTATLPAGIVAGKDAKHVIRKRDEKTFVRAGDSLALPPGYAVPKDASSNGLPSEIRRESDKTTFVLINGGDFMMGASDTASAAETEDRPAHPVRLSDYYLQQTEVTNGEIEAYFQEKKLDPVMVAPLWQNAWKELNERVKPDVAKRHPAVGISHALAAQFAADRGGRLPTEAEWEYAAGSGRARYPYVWGDSPAPNSDLAWIEEANQPFPMVADRAYGSDISVSWRIWHMTGNVREWCADLFAPYQLTKHPVDDPHGPSPNPKTSRPEFVVRGGSFLTFSDKFRTTRPRHIGTDDSSYDQVKQHGAANDLGFRIVVEHVALSPSPAP